MNIKGRGFLYSKNSLSQNRIDSVNISIIQKIETEIIFMPSRNKG